MPPLKLERNYWTNTIQLWTTLRFTELPWVCQHLFFIFTINLISLLVLHPADKLKYFSKQKWDKAWIDTAEEIVQEEFKHNYATYIVPKSGKASHPSKKVSPSTADFVDNILIFYQCKLDGYDSSNEDAQNVDLDPSTEENFVTELDNYLKSSQVKDVKDPLNWWYENCGLYPRLSCMARDYLMIPGKFFISFFLSKLKYLNFNHQVLLLRLNVYLARVG